MRSVSCIDRIVADVVRVAQDPCRGTDLVHVDVPSGRGAAVVAHAVMSALQGFGFVPLRASQVMADARAKQLTHRHVALLTFNVADDRAALAWLRRLSSASPRAHLVVSFRHVAATAVEMSEVADERTQRAERFDTRGRHAQAERWYRAALESARRRGDEAGQASACGKLVDLLCRRDRWEDACRGARTLHRELRQTQARAVVAALLAECLIAQAELGQADALISSALVELAIARTQPPARLNDARAQLRFWQGRLDELAAIPRTPGSVSRLLVDGVTAFLRRDGPHLADLAHEAAAIRTGTANLCQALFSLFAASLTRDEARVRVASVELNRLAREARCARLVRLASALRDEASVLAGFSPLTASKPRPRASSLSPPLLDGLFLDWQAAARSRDRHREGEASRGLVRLGARVVETWRWGCPDMHLVHAIPTLLQLVQDAEDDLAALVGTCGWLRREGRADSVAIVDTEQTVVAADGWDWSHTADVVADVRYAGCPTGSVWIRGSAERREALAEAAKTAAVVCGPALRARVDLLHAMRASPALSSEILGCSPSIVALREAVARAAATPFPVLVEGESGTGKELVARALHRLSARRDRRFVAVNCAALTDELVEAELFGHTRGAFTGAVGTRTGLVEDAHGGSLFLDEVSELSPRAQAKLLRVLQEREVRRVGENAPRPVDVRVVAATNRPLSEAVRTGVFRDDLLFRLAVVRLRLPPLRDRVEDVPLLAHAVWRSLATQTGRRALLGPDAMTQLCRHSWPGNVRELQNVMAALLVMAPERGRISGRHVAQILSSSPNVGQLPSLSLHLARANLERTVVAGALARHGGRRAPAARELGLTRQGLTKTMKRLGLDHDPQTGVA